MWLRGKRPGFNRWLKEEEEEGNGQEAGSGPDRPGLGMKCRFAPSGCASVSSESGGDGEAAPPSRRGDGELLGPAHPATSGCTGAPGLAAVLRSCCCCCEPLVTPEQLLVALGDPEPPWWRRQAAWAAARALAR